MPFDIRFKGALEYRKPLHFADDAVEITLGRDPNRCQVLFDQEETRVGREHCVIRRVAGKYRLIVNSVNPVFVNGRRVTLEDELPLEADLQLGVNGPILAVSTQLNSTLPRTSGNQELGSRQSILEGAHNLARQGRRIAGLAIVFAVMAFAYSRINDARTQIVISAVTDIRQLTNQQREELSSMGQRQWMMNRKIDQVDSGLRDVLKTAAKSTYLLLRRDQIDSAEPLATCWVLDREAGILATNGHVASEFGRLRDKEYLSARAFEQSGEVRIESVSFHPGYEEFQKLWNGYDPTRRVAERDFQSIRPAAIGCDVALLFVRPEDRERLAKSLPLADAEELKAINPGDPIGSTGFPLEDLSLNVNVSNPNPVRHQGYITQMMNDFGDASAPVPTRTLIQHSLPTAGGSSGSPILNRNGKVIAIHCSGNSFFYTKEIPFNTMLKLAQGKMNATELQQLQNQSIGRMNSSANLNFAQRIDLLDELWKNHAEDSQIRRTQTWRTEIQKSFQPRQSAAGIAVADRLCAEFSRKQSNSDEYIVTTEKITKLSDLEIPFEGTDSQLAGELAFEIDSAGLYLAAVIGRDGIPLDTTFVGPNGQAIVSSAHFGITSQRIGVLVVSDREKWSTRSTTTKGNSARLSVWSISRNRRTVDQLHKLLLERWSRSLNSRNEAVEKISLIRSSKGSLGPQVELPDSRQSVAEISFQIDRPGQYLVTLVGPEGCRLLLQIPSNKKQPEKIFQHDSWSSCTLEAQESAELQVLVASPEPVTEFEVRCYRRLR